MDAKIKEWQEANEWERQWWGDCVHTLRVELLQLEMAKRMGLKLVPTDQDPMPHSIDLEGRSVLDIGGGPCSLLLKCVNLCAKELDGAVVLDPCEYPDWVTDRYDSAGISLDRHAAENYPCENFDEAWIYNVLQHTQDPKLIIENARTAAKAIRIFEWIDTSISPGHLHSFTEAQLNEWLGGQGTVEEFRECGAVGRAWYGVFPCQR